jgi:hypothetical protein
MDIETALNFFLDRKEITKKKVGNMAKNLVNAWNNKYAGTKNVIYIYFILQQHFEYRAACKNILLFLFLIFQTANSRSGFSDYKVLSHMTWTDKNGVAQNSKIVLTVSNWHFNRDTLKDPIGPTCRIENVMVTLKLSSSVFEAGIVTGPPAGGSTNESDVAGEKDDSSSHGGDKAVVSRSGDVFHFDKNGCIIPYAAFVELLNDTEFEEYLEAVKAKYNSKEGQSVPLPEAATSKPSSASFRELDDDELRELKTNLSKKRKLNMIYGRGGKRTPAIEFANDDVFESPPLDFQPSQGRIRDLLGDDDDDDAEHLRSGAGGGAGGDSLESGPDEKSGKINKRRGAAKK